MKHLLIVLSFLLLSACQTTKKLKKSLLWQVRENRSTYPSFIFGTIHAMPENQFKIPARVHELVGLANTYYGELNFSDQQALAKAMINNVRMKNGTTLKELLTNEEYQLVKNYFENESTSQEAILIGFAQLEKWKPLLLTSVLVKDIINMPIKAYDTELYNLAKEKNKKIAGLETAEYQFKLFDEIDYKIQAQNLVKSIKEMHNTSEKNSLYQMIALYKNMDIVGLHKLIVHDGSQMFEEKLINDRNTNWVPIIEKSIKKECTFFAVGAGHLAGPKGLIRQLQKKGYLVEPVKLEDFK